MSLPFTEGGQSASSLIYSCRAPFFLWTPHHSYRPSQKCCLWEIFTAEENNNEKQRLKGIAGAHSAVKNLLPKSLCRHVKARLDSEWQVFDNWNSLFLSSNIILCSALRFTLDPLVFFV